MWWIADTPTENGGLSLEAKLDPTPHGYNSLAIATLKFLRLDNGRNRHAGP